MRLAADRRARVPFALLGVLVLVTSATLAASLSAGGRQVTDRAVDDAMDRVDAATGTALREAAREAAHDAAREPVTTRANSSLGRVLNATSPFRDSLRIRIYLAARDRLSAVRHRQQGVVATASLPPVRNATALRRAKRRVSLAPVANGTALRVTVRNLTRRAREDGEVVAREAGTVTVTVATPVMAAHRRTEAYERRLNRGAVAGPGLGRQLTARLYPIAWARGYAQHSGLEVENVVANRHVELATNGGCSGASGPSSAGATPTAGGRAGERPP